MSALAVSVFCARAVRHSMPKILWQDSYSVGFPTLDEHHKHLARLINQLSDFGTGEGNSEAVDEVIMALVQYAMYHFEHEEKLMDSLGYPRLDSHRLEHTQFCEVITETSYGATLGIIDLNHLTDYLVRWWKNHILQEDMQLKSYFLTGSPA